MLGPYVSYEACGMECDDWFGFMCNRFDRLWNFELRLFDALNRWHRLYKLKFQTVFHTY